MKHDFRVIRVPIEGSTTHQWAAYDENYRSVRLRFQPHCVQLWFQHPMRRRESYPLDCVIGRTPFEAIERLKKALAKVR